MGGKPRARKIWTSTLGEPGGYGVLPIRSYNGLKVVESDGFAWPGLGAKRRGKGHIGSDYMLRRKKSGRVRRPGFVKHFTCPTGKVEAINVRPGVVWSVRRSERNGWTVKIMHGNRYMTVHRHLASTVVKAGQCVCMATPLGIVGHAPSAGKRGINHDHFEIWDWSKPGNKSRLVKSVDPSPWLKGWRQV